jgi:uncharacterized protein YbbK (DUF523 family)
MNNVIIVSACLAGIKCRYNGKSACDLTVKTLVKEGKAIPVCSEVLGGLPTPRSAVEIVGNCLLDQAGRDYTKEFTEGAKKGLEIAVKNRCKKAILKSKSPSCGFGLIYDGSFTGKLKKGNGVFADLLQKNGIEIQSK